MNNSIKNLDACKFDTGNFDTRSAASPHVSTPHVSTPHVSTLNVSTLALLAPKKRSRWLQNMARKLVLTRLEAFSAGKLTIVEDNATYVFGTVQTTKNTLAMPHRLDARGPGSEQSTLEATIIVHDPRFYGEIAFGGSIGAGEAYMLGYWSCENLTQLIRLMVLNQGVMDDLEGGMAWLAKPVLKTLHWMNRNTQDGSRRNIAAHYDLGNDMFQLFLDPTMMYSSAIFDDADTSLDQAALRKLDHICRKLALSPLDHVVEIGTGWGGFAIYAASHYGCNVTTTTISKAQYEMAVQRVEAAGLQHKINVVLKDYRDLEGKFDKLVSIEMIEAVGHAYYDTYFAKCADLLKPDGMMLIQAITIADQRYESAKNSVDFIQRYIFPGSCIPSVTALLASVTRASDLRLFNLEDIGPHYARTLAEWRIRFFRNIEHVKALGYPQEFINMWEFYLCYCEGGFEERALGDVHMLLVKPGNRREALVSKN